MTAIEHLSTVISKIQERDSNPKIICNRWRCWRYIFTWRSTIHSQRISSLDNANFDRSWPSPELTNRLMVTIVCYKSIFFLADLLLDLEKINFMAIGGPVSTIAKKSRMYTRISFNDDESHKIFRFKGLSRQNRGRPVILVVWISLGE